MLSAAEILTDAHRITGEGFELWLASNGDVLDTLDLELGSDDEGSVSLTPLDFLGPYERSWKLEDLMRAYNVLNATAFGAKGIPLQNWVMIDLGLLPSGFLLITLPREAAERALTDPALRVHRKFGPMRLLAAVLDLHPVHHTMAYRTEVFGADSGGCEPTLLLDPRDLDAQWALQRRLDAGTHEYFILSPGLVEDRVPILERTL